MMPSLLTLIMRWPSRLFWLAGFGRGDSHLRDGHILHPDINGGLLLASRRCASDKSSPGWTNFATGALVRRPANGYRGSMRPMQALRQSRTCREPEHAVAIHCV